MRAEVGQSTCTTLDGVFHLRARFSASKQSHTLVRRCPGCHGKMDCKGKTDSGEAGRTAAVAIPVRDDGSWTR